MDRVKFSAPQDLMCQASVACVEIQNVCPEDKFYEMVHNSDPVFFGLYSYPVCLKTFLVCNFTYSCITKGYVGYVGS